MILVIAAACSAVETHTGEEVGDGFEPTPVRVLHEQARDRGLDFQAELLADGEVDYRDYESAVLATIQCLREQGFTVLGPAEASDGTLDYAYGGAAPGTSDEAADAGLECEEEYLFLIAIAYQEAIYPTQQERQKLEEAYRDCLREAGVEVDADAASDLMDILAMENGASSCSRQFSYTASITDVTDLQR